MSGHVRVTVLSGRDATNLQPDLHLKRKCGELSYCFLARVTAFESLGVWFDPDVVV